MCQPAKYEITANIGPYIPAPEMSMYPGTISPRAQIFVLRCVVPDMSADDANGEETTRVTRKGQVTIPKELREEYGLEEGDEVRWELTDDGIQVRKATRSAGRGMLLDEDVSDEKREQVAEEMEEEIREKRRTDWQP